MYYKFDQRYLVTTSMYKYISFMLTAHKDYNELAICLSHNSLTLQIINVFIHSFKNDKNIH